MEGEHSDAVIQIHSEQIFLHHLFQVPVGGGDDPHVHRYGAGAAHPADLLLLEHPQQLGLQVKGHVSDFVQENGSGMGELEQALFSALFGPGEGALLIAEQLAFQQVPGKGGAVDGDKRLFTTAGSVVDGVGEQLLAGAGFAGDEHRVVRGRHAPGVPYAFGHGPAVAQNVGKRIFGGVFLLHRVQTDLLLQLFDVLNVLEHDQKSTVVVIVIEAALRQGESLSGGRDVDDLVVKCLRPRHLPGQLLGQIV